MTEEQIKALKVGDKISVEYTVSGIKKDDIICGSVFINGESYPMTFDVDCAALKTATLVTTPPTFEVGDTVRIVPDPLTGTIYGNGVNKDEFAGKENKVLEKANEWGNVRIKTHFGSILVNIHCLELVKKGVKDKYIVEEDDLAWCVTDKNWSVCYFNKRNHPSARDAAEAECARLNAAWRKQQEGGAE